MITYNKLAEQVILDLSGGDKSRDSELEFPDVVLKVRQAVSEIVKMNVFTNSKVEGALDASFHYIYTKEDVPVTWDKTACKCYSTLSMVPMEIPGNRGIKEIVPIKNPQRPFIPIKSGQIGMIADMIEEGEVVYWPEKDKIYYHKNITDKYTKVHIKMAIPAPDDLDADTNFFLPDDIQAAVLDRVKMMLNPQMPQDKLNNTNKNI